MNKKILISLSVIAGIAAIVIGATTAYFSNTEKSEGNTFIAGAIDLKIDNECHYNGNVCKNGIWQGNSPYPEPGTPCSCTWSLADWQDGTAIFNFSDIKPGDWGEDTISLHVDTNPAWVCAEISNIKNFENGCNPPEAKVDQSCGNSGEGEGELQDNLFFNVWMDNGAGNHACNNILDEDERYILVDAKATDVKWPIADSTTGGQPIQSTCIGVEWFVPDNANNIIQGDSVTGDITFKAYQARHNTPFYCYPVCGNGIVEANEECDDGNNTDGDGCNANCQREYCGDGIIQSGLGEECDGSAPEHYTCESCKLIYHPYCGDGNVDQGEECDDGNNQNGDGCSATCQRECFSQADIMLVLDKSSSISQTEMNQLKAAATAFVNTLNPDGGVHMGQTSFADMNGNGSLDLQLTGNKTDILNAINALSPGGYTNLYDGIRLADQELESIIRDRDDVQTPDYMIIITDGMPNRPGCGGTSPCGNARNTAASAAITAKNKGVTIFVVGVGIENSSDEDYLRYSIASSPAYYYSISQYAQLQAILEQIATCQFTPASQAPRMIFGDPFGSSFASHWTEVYNCNGGSNPTCTAGNTNDVYPEQANSTWYAEMQNNSGLRTATTFSTAGYKDIILHYYRRTESIAGQDRFRILWRPGTSGNWTQLEEVSGNVEWAMKIYNLPASANNSSIQVLVWLDDGSGDYGQLDNVVLIGTPQ